MYYTYAHIRPDTKVIFYVGKGSKRRAFSKQDRNSDWRSIVEENNGKFDVKILNWFTNKKDAYAAEVWQIAELSSAGNLTNKTLGGEGGWNNWLPEMRERASRRTTLRNNIY